MQTSKVAVCVSDSAMFYRVWAAGVSPLHQVGGCVSVASILSDVLSCLLHLQLASFLDLKEEAVAGYEQPSVVTELHAHLINCSLEYQ